MSIRQRLGPAQVGTLRLGSGVEGSSNSPASETDGENHHPVESAVASRDPGANSSRSSSQTKVGPDEEARLAMTRKPPGLTRQMERLIEAALMPGRFVAYNGSFSFVRDLEAVEQRLAKARSMDPAKASALYE